MDTTSAAKPLIYIDVPDLDFNERIGRTEVNKALNDAALFGKNDVITAALAAGADPNHQDSDGMTALHSVAYGDDADVVRLLIDHGANPNLRNNLGETPLHIAARSWSEDCTKALLEGGADPSIVDERGATSLIGARTVENVDLLLSAGADPNHQNEWGCTALHTVADRGDADVLRLLIDHGANPNLQDNLGETPLHIAARSPYEEGTKALLEGGADPGIVDERGATPLIGAHTAENVDLLLDYGADINARDRHGDTALHLQAQNQRSPALTATLQKLYDHGVIQVQPSQSSEPTALDRLIDRGADRSVTNNTGKTPLDYLPKGFSSPAIERIALREAVEDVALEEQPRRQRARL
ncbi:ankyrin repeat domain-containing protein [Burkholderia vietnamiensis]|uniref:ankyrin repeat domain-containing protein n=1 Tax=Burkholderia vietnamiensis TaxID=60552 RepID=UPI001CF5292B|nr:ankyrin repeat domain-containing protein [Burkholderia vietnamiensis]MCA8448891.1 ankyrin repeat domain-containing protein [Burkholderia vietnamiensis]